MINSVTTNVNFEGWDSIAPISCSSAATAYQWVFPNSNVTVGDVTYFSGYGNPDNASNNISRGMYPYVTTGAEWNFAYPVQNVSYSLWNVAYPVWNGAYFPETTEQRIAREEALRNYAVKAEAAASKAEELLFMCISEEQKQQYLVHGYFDTTINDKTYRIGKGRSYNVFLVERGKPKFKYCAHPSLFVPDQDTMLAQYLMLTTDEDKFLRTANRAQLY